MAHWQLTSVPVQHGDLHRRAVEEHSIFVKPPAEAPVFMNLRKCIPQLLDNILHRRVAPAGLCDVFQFTSRDLLDKKKELLNSSVVARYEKLVRVGQDCAKFRYKSGNLFYRQCGLVSLVEFVQMAYLFWDEQQLRDSNCS